MSIECVNGVPTHVFSLRSETSLEGVSSSVPLILIIPGSPGMGHSYEPLACSLFSLGQSRFDVSVVSHAGHSPGHYKTTATSPRQDGLPSEDPTDWYTLQDQIAHKLAFIQEEALHRHSLILIGHSIGCWMLLHMMAYLPPTQISKAFLLFPVVEKMALSPKGLSWLPMLWHSLRLPFTGLVWALSSFTPNFIKDFILTRVFYTTPERHLEPITRAAKNIDEKSIYNVLKMAEQEMEEVVEPPLDLINANIDKIVFYYGQGDRWNTENCYHNMAARYPDKDVNLCPAHFPHAFVEFVSEEMAEMIYSKL